MARGLKTNANTQATDATKPVAFGGDVLADIDWSQPWFAPWRELGEITASEALKKRSVAQALNVLQADNAVARTVASSNGAIKEVKFVPQADLPEGQAYEDFIFKTAQVPTRDGLHDFFNGLCWHRFPKAKRRLNQLQAAEIAAQGVQATRGPVRDALTLFDENVVLMHAPDEVWAALQARDWLRLMVDLREQWQQVHLVLFGHALLEKLITPYKSITGHVYRIDSEVNPHDEAGLDDWLVQDLQARKLATKPYEPLPVLGVPGWWAANGERAFYEDTQVFRPKRVMASSAPSA